ncbi:hypothetical protein EVJ30_04095 [Exiguobacterium sp. SH5S13]|uniref:hypothetical protein n=1 Tax=Exiguobacterium sp. SH5S13 TaxID=2510959 RepID=UPI00104027C2|nr:hypothetical protein [Exiguobacterium sp. SH5S13]TCI56709.1 hypothetical protein EVJ30_04095 [Exiguobacterium sp. SH5S13]
MKRFITLLAAVALLASCTQETTDRPIDSPPKNENIVIDVSETQPFSEPVPTEKEVSIFLGYLQSLSSDTLGALRQSEQSTFACGTSCEDRPLEEISTQIDSNREELESIRADIDEILPALDHLVSSDVSGIDREGLTNVLNEFTSVSEALTQFLEADDWSFWEEARTQLNSMSSTIKGIAIYLSGV